jgi:hypothetical protein
MANTIFKLRRSSVAGKVPNTASLSIGELAINLSDKKLYSSDGSQIFETGANLNSLNVSTNTTLNVVNVASNATVNNIIFTGGIFANGEFGTSGQVLSTNGSAVYWGTGGGSANGILDVRQQYVGDGTSNTYIVTGGYRPNDISVFINGVMLRNGVDVDVTDGGTFSFTTAPVNGALIDVVGIGTLYANGVSTTTSQQFTANGTANSFTISGGYVPYQIQVYLNGVKQIPGTDVIISSGSTVDFTSTPANNFIVDIFGYQTSLLLSIDTTAQYTWTNTHTFTQTIIGTVNNSLYIGGTSAANVVSNAQLQANLSNYQTSAGLASNVAILTANNANNLLGYTWASPGAIGSVTANTGAFTNVSVNTTVSIGNSTVNSTVNTSVLQISNTTGTANITPTSIFLGNSSVNCVINSTSVYVNGVDYNPTTALAIAVALS